MYMYFNRRASLHNHRHHILPTGQCNNTHTHNKNAFISHTARARTHWHARTPINHDASIYYYNNIAPFCPKIIFKVDGITCGLRHGTIRDVVAWAVTRRDKWCIDVEHVICGAVLCKMWCQWLWRLALLLKYIGLPITSPLFFLKNKSTFNSLVRLLVRWSL